MSIPESIRCHKPSEFGACEIRYIGGYYYVYPVTSKWDAEKGRSQIVVTVKDTRYPQFRRRLQRCLIGLGLTYYEKPKGSVFYIVEIAPLQYLSIYQVRSGFSKPGYPHAGHTTV